MVIRRELLALGHPQPEAVNFDDETSLRNFIVWLEDQKIRNYTIEDRSALRDIQSANWKDVYAKYLSDLQAPFTADQFQSSIEWLIGMALRFDFEDNADACRKCAGDEKNGTDSAEKSGSDNPFESWDFESAEVKEKALVLAQLLDVPPHHDHRELLKACCMIVCERLSQETIDKLAAARAGESTMVEPVNLEQVPLGFDAGDYITTQAAKLLRLLHIRSLRELQTSVDIAIVRVQKLTANPKTDQKLGQVGY